MKKKESVYVGGERDTLRQMTPRHYERFFDKRMMFLVLSILSAFSLMMLVIA